MNAEPFNPQHGYELPLSEVPAGKAFATISLVVSAGVCGLRIFDTVLEAKQAWMRAPSTTRPNVFKQAYHGACSDPRSLLLLVLCVLTTTQAAMDVAVVFKSTAKTRWILHYPTYTHTAIVMYSFCLMIATWCALWRSKSLGELSLCGHHVNRDVVMSTLAKQPCSHYWWYRLLGKIAMLVGPVVTPLAILITIRSLDVQAARPTATLEWKSWVIPSWALALYMSYPIVSVAWTVASYVTVFGPPSISAMCAQIRSSLRALKTSPTTAASPVGSPSTSPIPMDHPLLPHVRQDAMVSAPPSIVASMHWTYRLLTLLYTIGWIACVLLVGSIMVMLSLVTWIPLVGLVCSFLGLLESQFRKCEQDAVVDAEADLSLAIVNSARLLEMVPPTSLAEKPQQGTRCREGGGDGRGRGGVERQ